MIKSNSKRAPSSLIYYGLIFVSLILSLFLAISLVGKHTEDAIVDYQQTATELQADLIKTKIVQLIETDLQLIKELTEIPLLANTVMGNESSLVRLTDLLDDYRFLGRKENIVVVDILGEPIYSSDEQLLVVKDDEGMTKVLNAETPYSISTISLNNQSYLRFFYPIKYNGFTEGVVIVTFNRSLETIFNSIIDSAHQAITMGGDFFHFSSIENSSNYQVFQEYSLLNNTLKMAFLVDETPVKREVSQFKFQMTFAVSASLILSFLLLGIVGRRFVLNPFKQLENSEKQLRDALDQSRLFTIAIEATSVGVSIVDMQEYDNPLIYVNEAFLKMTGYTYADSIGKNCRFLQGKDTDKNVVHQLRSAIKRGEDLRVELINYRKDGTPFWNSLHISPVHDDNNNLKYFIGVQQDITELKDLEIKQLEAKLASEKARKAAEDSNKAKSQFLASMSHEIRTPLNGVIGMLDLLKGSELTGIQAKRAELAMSSANALLGIINDVLDFSKIEAGKMEIEETEFNIHKLLGEYLESVAPLAAHKGTSLILDTADIVQASIIGDSTRFQQIITNLVGNAIKFTENGKIKVSASIRKVSSMDYLLKCDVQDTGIGIPLEKINTLFDRFSQVDASTTRKYGGTGLGLAIVKRLTKLMGGDVEVISKLGKGTTFTITLPVKCIEQNNIFQPAFDLSNLNVLLVDNEHSTAAVMNKLIEKWKAKVTLTKGYDEAIRLFTNKAKSEQSGFDVIFINRYLLGESIAGAVSELKTLNDNSDVRCILMTAIIENETAEEYKEMGFDYYFTKPVTGVDLINSFNLVGKSLNLNLIEDEENKKVSRPPKHTEIHKNSNYLDSCILVVEDNKVNQLVIKGILENFNFSNVIYTDNGQQALDYLSNHSEVSIVLMDCHMPILDGYETTQLIRLGDVVLPNKELPIIALTANAMEGDREKCIQAGMNDYLTKPVNKDELKAKLMEWLG